jgi:murein DD-endopeptidase MepM/ murein hydrolase activator NlpD
MATETSQYGPRSLFGRNFHHGIDYRAPVGAPVYTNQPVTVTHTGYQKGYGNVVYAKDAAGNEYRYGHLDSIPPGVAPGKTLQPGDQIATTGNTGQSTGAHLHYEVRKPDGSSVNPKDINPATGKPYTHAATFEQGKESLGASSPTKDPAYKPNGKPDTRSVNPGKPNTAPSQPGTVTPGVSAPAAAKKKNNAVNTIISINPVLRLGDE